MGAVVQGRTALAGLLDEAWYLDPGEEVRVERLIARHVAYGKPLAAARAWSLGSDQRNADLVELTRDRADRIIRVAEDSQARGLHQCSAPGGARGAR